MGALLFGTWPGSKRHPARDGRGKCDALPSQTIDSVFAARTASQRAALRSRRDISRAATPRHRATEGHRTSLPCCH